MDILSLKLFLRVAELGVLSGAAKDLYLSTASASARLAKLEEETGFRLFNRTTRAISLTTDGAAFLPYAQQAIETLETGLNTSSGELAQPKGLLRIAMSGSFGRMHIIPHLAKFQERYPFVSLDLRLSDEIVDVIEGAYDLIVRNTPLIDGSLVARKLAVDKRILVAAPSYLKAHGIPTKPEDLLQHKCICLSGDNRWKFTNEQIVTVERTFSVNDGEAMRSMLTAGMAIGPKSIWNAYKYLKSGELVEVLADFPILTESSIWALYPSNRVVATKVRVMIDFLLELFQPSPPWESLPYKT